MIYYSLAVSTNRQTTKSFIVNIRRVGVMVVWGFIISWVGNESCCHCLLELEVYYVVSNMTNLASNTSPRWCGVEGWLFLAAKCGLSERGPADRDYLGNECKLGKGTKALVTLLRSR